MEVDSGSRTDGSETPNPSTFQPVETQNLDSQADETLKIGESGTEKIGKKRLELRKMLDLLVHASQCRSAHCQYPNCRKVKGLFRHGISCRTLASGGCVLCKKMWYLLQLHARACKESECHVPRCKDLKERLRRLQQQSDSRRRAAVTEMMRQRAAEVAGEPSDLIEQRQKFRDEHQIDPMEEEVSEEIQNNENHDDDDDDGIISTEQLQA